MVTTREVKVVMEVAGKKNMVEAANRKDVKKDAKKDAKKDVKRNTVEVASKVEVEAMGIISKVEVDTPAKDVNRHMVEIMAVEVDMETTTMTIFLALHNTPSSMLAILATPTYSQAFLAC